jgi:hypothetical protein
MKRLLLVAIISLFFTGCSGKLYTVANEVLPGPGEKVEGVVFYPPMNVIEVYKTTISIDKDTGKVVGKESNGSCEPVRVEKKATRPDYSSPSRIYYDAGLFETNAFGVTLKNGVLAGVNTSSDPSKAMTAITGYLPYVGKPQAFAAATGPLACNAQEVLLKIMKAPPAGKFVSGSK